VLLAHFRLLFAQYSRGAPTDASDVTVTPGYDARHMNSASIRPTYLPQDLKVRSIEALTGVAFVAAAGLHAAIAQASHTWH
jgi:hypothetical protein